MISVSAAEIVTIALIAFIVFGPKRLPTMARKAGRIMRDLKATASELKAGLEAEYGDTSDALDDVRRSLGPTLVDEQGDPSRAPESPAGEP
jgi:sec-independent protein translocase protein TatB